MTIKFRQLNEVIMQKGTFSQESGYGPAQGSLIMDATRLATAIKGRSQKGAWCSDGRVVQFIHLHALSGVRFLESDSESL